ncbi:MAG: hypothetical protein Q8K41_20410, partial [Hydrogenophaga sp.]|nr:hypothetical protein [Hydrogenophaga sp.]
ISISGDGSAAVSAAAAAASEALATAGAATAMTQAGIATTQAGIATTQATASATSANASGNAATAALASQTAAAASASDAAASFDSFDDRYLGAKAAEPALDNDGNALLTGALYYRTTAPVGMKVFGGATWAAAAALAPSAFIETLLDDANAAAARATLELGIVATQNTVPIAQGGTGAATELAARASLGVARGIEPIAASVASNNLTITINPTTLDFRSTTLGDGAVSTVSLASAVSCVVPNGATLGSIPAFLTRLAVLAINNAGTIEVAVVALTGSVDLSEKGLISTTALSTGADSDNVVYSTTARTNVAYRLVGFIEYTQAAAGVYATAPSLVGGNSSPLAMWLAGYGRKWQTVTRTSGVNYTNLTGRDIQFLVTGNNSAATQVTCAVDNFAFPTTIQSAGGVFSILADYPIPPGSVYTYTVAVGTVTVSELR